MLAKYNGYLGNDRLAAARDSQTEEAGATRNPSGPQIFVEQVVTSGQGVGVSTGIRNGTSFL